MKPNYLKSQAVDRGTVKLSWYQHHSTVALELYIILVCIRTGTCYSLFEEPSVGYIRELCLSLLLMGKNSELSLSLPLSLSSDKADCSLCSLPPCLPFVSLSPELASFEKYFESGYFDLPVMPVRKSSLRSASLAAISEFVAPPYVSVM